MRIVLLVLSALLLVACGSRSVPSLDGSGADSGGKDDGMPRVEGGVKPDTGACVRPPGGCFGPQDCPPGQDCKGCGPDPCCPMCAVCYGKCVPQGECWKNSDCANGQWCNLDGGDCGKTIPGKCDAIASDKDCPSLHAPVCGCDGTTYSNTCVAHVAGVSVAGPGPCNKKKCEAVNKSYVAEVQAAKKCCAGCDSIQCTKKIKNDLACPCETFVEPANAGSITKLQSLENQWNALGCSLVGFGCPPMPCKAVTLGSCMPDAAGSGTCQDSG